MTVGGAIAIGFLLVVVVLVLRGIRGHRRSGDVSVETYSDNWLGE